MSDFSIIKWFWIWINSLQSFLLRKIIVKGLQHVTKKEKHLIKEVLSLFKPPWSNLVNLLRMKIGNRLNSNENRPAYLNLHTVISTSSSGCHSQVAMPCNQARRCKGVMKSFCLSYVIKTSLEHCEIPKNDHIENALKRSYRRT